MTGPLPGPPPSARKPQPPAIVLTDRDASSTAPPTTAEVVAATVLAVPGVVKLHGGRFGELATYLPGRRVIGVRIDERGTEVHVVVSAAVPPVDTAGRIQRAVSAVAPMPVRVHIEDIVTL